LEMRACPVALHPADSRPWAAGGLRCGVCRRRSSA